MFPSWLAVTLLLGCVQQPAEGAKILVVPVPLRSLFNLGIQAGKALRQSGHEVWLMGPQGKSESFTHTDMTFLPYDCDPLYQMENIVADSVLDNYLHPEKTSFGIVSKLSDAITANEAVCKSTLSNKSLMRTIADQQFDLALMGTVMVLGCLYHIPHKFDIPYMTFQPLDNPWVAGVSAMPSVTPTPLMDPPVTHLMTFSERVRNTLGMLAQPVVFHLIDERGFQSWFSPESPARSVSQLRAESLMWLIVVDQTCLDYPRLSTPHYRHVGALAADPARPLTGDLKAFAEGAKHGLILAGYGSTKLGSHMMGHSLQMFRDIARQIPQRILIQYIGLMPEQAEGFPDNVLLQKWIPQNDVLGHPNTVAMVTHGGANGQMESVFHSVPMVCVPLIEEQRYNCLRVAHHHYGVVLPITDLNTDSLLQAMITVTTDSTFKANVSKCSRIMRQLPQGKQQMQFWVDHVLEFGADHLRPASADMPLYSHLMLDVIAFFVAVISLVVAVIMTVCVCLCRCIRKVTKMKKE